MSPSWGTAEKLTTEIVTSSLALSALGSDWNALHTAGGGGNPFNQWAWVWQWWRTYGRDRGLVRDQLHIHVQRDNTGAVRAILPFVITSSGVGPIAVRKLRLFGSVPGDNLTELPQVLIQPGWEAASATTLMDALWEMRGTFHWCELDGLPLYAALGRWFVSRAGSAGWSPRPVVPYFTLTLPDTWEALRASLKPHIKKNIRNSHAALARDGHQWTFETVTEPGQLEPALAEFYQLHSARAASDKGPRHPDHFSSPSARRFLESVARDLAAVGGFRICRLRVDGAVIASRLVLVSGGCCYLYHSGFDPAWWRYSVTTTLAAECIKMAIQAGAHTVNLSTGRDAGKTRWGPQEHLVGGVRIVPSVASSRIVTGAHDWARALGQAVRPRSSGTGAGSSKPVAQIPGVPTSSLSPGLYAALGWAASECAGRAPTLLAAAPWA